MFGFRSSSSNLDNDLIREANVQIELMHNESETYKKKIKQLEDENTKLKYQLHESTKLQIVTEEELKETKNRLKELVCAFEPLDKLYKTLNLARKKLNLSDFNKTCNK